MTMNQLTATPAIPINQILMTTSQQESRASLKTNGPPPKINPSNHQGQDEYANTDMSINP